MSTRAVYSFKDSDGTYHVYKHHDGYPTGAAQWLARAQTLAWQLPRYEADEFAAAFVAANKLPFWCDDQILEGINKSRKSPQGKMLVETVNPYPDSDGAYGGGGVRLLHSGGDQSVYDISPGDIEYRYEVYQGNDKKLRVKAFSTDYWDTRNEEILFDCTLDAMPKFAKEYEDSH